VMENGHLAGTVRLFTQAPFDKVAFLFAILALVFAISFVSFQIQRNVVKPLESMAKAARKIAHGNLDFEVRSTRVSEIAEVREAFHAMRDGLRTSITHQAKLEEERRFFVSAIAHDLRTPLFALRGYLEGIWQGIANSPDKSQEYLTICREKADQLDRLVSDLFAFTKMEYLEKSLHGEEMDFAQVIERSMDTLRPQAQTKNVQMVSTDGSHPCLMRGDAHLLERVICNLLENAIRHSPTSGQITVAWYQDNSKITFSVADMGKGFAAADLPYVFNPLYRAETSRNRETGGAGLGLTIAKRIVKAHGGDLLAANQPTGGAILTGWIHSLN